MQKRKSRQRVFSVAVAFLMLVMSASAVAQQAPLQVPTNEIDGFDRGPRTYIVMMSEEPAGAYRGGTAGFAATRPEPGTRIDVNAPHVSAYRDHLRGRHDAALASVGGGSKIYDYGVAFNGFAAVLTGAQAALLARDPGVVAIFENEKQHLDTMSTPDFLGLSDPGGAWSQRFVGDRIIIGVVDSGIRPESPSFSETPAANPDGTGVHPFGGIPFHGICQTGEQFDANDCNNKLIGARFYHAGFGTEAELRAKRTPLSRNTPGTKVSISSPVIGSRSTWTRGASSTTGTPASATRSAAFQQLGWSTRVVRARKPFSRARSRASGTSMGLPQ